MEYTMDKDPVCGRPVDPVDAPESSIYQERIYYFCSEKCRKRFDRNPAKFTKKPEESAA